MGEHKQPKQTPRANLRVRLTTAIALKGRTSLMCAVPIDSEDPKKILQVPGILEMYVMDPRTLRGQWIPVEFEVPEEDEPDSSLIQVASRGAPTN